MATSTEPSRNIFFAEFELDLRTGELIIDGQKQKLQEKPFQVLAALLERPGQLVSRDELVKRLWGSGTFVDFDQSLNKAVNRLREALGDSAEEPRFIERLPRRGYRFLAQVKAPTVAVDHTPELGTGEMTSATGYAPLDRAAMTLGVCALLTLMIVLGVKFAPWTSHSQDGPATSAPIRSLAVLPMENLSGDSS